MAMTNGDRFDAANNNDSFRGAVAIALNRHGYYVLGREGATEGKYIPTEAHLKLAKVAATSPGTILAPIAMRLLTIPASDDFADVADATDDWLAENVPAVFEDHADLMFPVATASTADAVREARRGEMRQRAGLE